MQSAKDLGFGLFAMFRNDLIILAVTEGFEGVCLYGCYSGSLIEICAVSKCSKKEMGRSYKVILKTLETSVSLVTTGDFMSRFCTSLGLSITVQKLATHISNKAVEMDLVPGRSPISVAAAAIYMAAQVSDEKITVKDICDISGVSEQTLKQTFKSIYPKAAELFPSDFKFIAPVEYLPPS